MPQNCRQGNSPKRKQFSRVTVTVLTDSYGSVKLKIFSVPWARRWGWSPGGCPPCRWRTGQGCRQPDRPPPSPCCRRWDPPQTPRTTPRQTSGRTRSGLHHSQLSNFLFQFFLVDQLRKYVRRELDVKVVRITILEPVIPEQNVSDFFRDKVNN